MVEWDGDERRRMNQLLGVRDSPPTYANLCRLMRAWLFSIPFHNLDLLAGESPMKLERATERCLDGRGGGCHVHAAGFCALLRASGYNASLASATIGAPEDHLLVVVRLDGLRYWVDVGNGQPYVRPFCDTRTESYSHLGWSVRTTPVDAGVRLERRSPDQPVWRQVYVTAAPNRTWGSFSESIERHHTERGFGPFLTGLRAVRIEAQRMRTLRDDVFTEYDESGFRKERLVSEKAIVDAAQQLVPGRDLARCAVRAWWQCRESSLA